MLFNQDVKKIHAVLAVAIDFSKSFNRQKRGGGTSKNQKSYSGTVLQDDITMSRLMTWQYSFPNLQSNVQ